MKAVLNIVAAVLIAAGLVVAVASLLTPGQVILGIDFRLAATLVVGGLILHALASALALLERMSHDLRQLRKASSEEPPWLRDSAAQQPTAQQAAAQPAAAMAPAATTAATAATASGGAVGEDRWAAAAQDIGDAPTVTGEAQWPETAEAQPAAMPEPDAAEPHALETEIPEPELPEEHVLEVPTAAGEAEDEPKPEPEYQIPQELEPAGEDETEAASDTVPLQPGEEAAEAPVEPEPVEPELVEPELVEPEMVEPEMVEPEMVEPEAAEPEAVEAQAVEPEMVEAELAEPEPAELEPAELEPAEPGHEDQAPGKAAAEAEAASEPEPTEVATEAEAAGEPEPAETVVEDRAEVPSKLKPSRDAAQDLAEPAEIAAEPAPDHAPEEQAELYVVEERMFRGKQARVLSDGTIEAETAEGWMRFEDFDHLEEYLEAMAEAGR